MDIEALKSWSQFGHPLLMWVVLALAIYTGYLGWQVRRTRTADSETRKELVKKQFKVKHYQLGSILLVLIILGTLGGMAITYINNGKLFVGAHLLTGLTMTAILAMSVALAPLMQKGNDAARYTHIALNASLLGLFGWQAVSGMEIVQKILSNFQS